MTKHRLELFSDGVFAVAITLLVFDLHVPHEGNGRLARALLDQWPAYASFVVSFLLIGIVWVNHHTMFHHIVRVDRPLLFLNLLVLMSVVVVPFPTSLLAAYIRTGSDSHVAAAVYSGTLFVLGLMMVLNWWHAVYHGLLGDEVQSQNARLAFPRFCLGPCVFAATIALAFVSAPVCLAMHAVVDVYYVFDHAMSVEKHAPAVPKQPLLAVRDPDA